MPTLYLTNEAFNQSKKCMRAAGSRPKPVMKLAVHVLFKLSTLLPGLERNYLVLKVLFTKLALPDAD